MGNDLQLELAALTDVGRMRQANEDNMGHAEFPWGQVFVVCDGMGGHVGGATASHIAVTNLLEFFARDLMQDPVESLRNAVHFANEQIYAHALNHPELKGMGTTCVILLQKATGLWLAHVGDSRIYLFTDGNLVKLTRDHSFVQGLVDQGTILEEDAESHPRKNELMRALGIGSHVEVEITQTPVFPKKGDVFMLCSDGLNGMLGDRNMEVMLGADGSLEAKATALVAGANAAGGSDNITVQLVQVIASPHLSNRYVAIKPPINTARTMPVAEAVSAPAPVQDNRTVIQRYGIVIGVCVVIFIVGILGITGVLTGSGKAAERAKFVQDSLKQDSLQRVAEKARADSTTAADSSRAAFVADSLHEDSVKRKLIKPAKKQP